MRLIAVILASLVSTSVYAQGTALGGGTTVIQNCNVPGACGGGNGNYNQQNNRTAREALPIPMNEFDDVVAQCGADDEASASACGQPLQIIQLLQTIGSSLNSSNPKTACLQMEILYSTATTLEMIWATKCQNAASRCINSCQTAQRVLAEHKSLCEPNLPLYEQWRTQTKIFEDCKQQPCEWAGQPREVWFCCGAKIPKPYSVQWGAPNCPTNYPDDLQCRTNPPGVPVLCNDPNTPTQRTDVGPRLRACQSDKAKSWAAMMEAGMMGYAAVLNELCRRDAGNSTGGTSGSTTGPTPPLGPDCNTREKRKVNPECMPNFCTEFVENVDHAACSCEIDMWYASPRCNCKHKADKTNPACKPPPTPPGTPPFLPPPRTPIPTPPPIGGTRPTPTPVPNPNRPTPTLNEDIDGGVDQEYNPAGGPGGPKQSVNDPGGGGGGGISSLGLGAGGGGAGAATGEGPYNTDINKGYSNAGGGMAGGGGGYIGPAGGGGYGPEGEKDKMNFKDFLPKVDKDRGLAGADGDPANGITGANGLSNWEKVTRKMNEKRPVLLP